ncbi:hypothetical protein C8Q79DRAFT_1012611 [Trametes meyenii]|nr:hypothetical protein C8Q79DRAFT_1012611 [Trametes meyenii]
MNGSRGAAKRAHEINSGLYNPRTGFLNSQVDDDSAFADVLSIPSGFGRTAPSVAKKMKDGQKPNARRESPEAWNTSAHKKRKSLAEREDGLFASSGLKETSPHDAAGTALRENPGRSVSSGGASLRNTVAPSVAGGPSHLLPPPSTARVLLMKIEELTTRIIALEEQAQQRADEHAKLKFEFDRLRSEVGVKINQAKEQAKRVEDSVRRLDEELDLSRGGEETQQELYSMYETMGGR